MESVSAALRDFFAGAIYPAIVLLTCVVVFGTCFFVAARARTARAIIAAIVPIVALPFLVVSHEAVGDPLLQAIDMLIPTARFLLGVAAAVVLLEIGRSLLNSSNEIGPALFVFFLGSAGAFFVYALMSNGLAVAHFIFFGFVIGGGVHMVLRGVPVPERLLRDWPLGTTVKKAVIDVARSVTTSAQQPTANSKLQSTDGASPAPTRHPIRPRATESSAEPNKRVEEK